MIKIQLKIKENITLLAYFPKTPKIERDREGNKVEGIIERIGDKYVLLEDVLDYEDLKKGAIVTVTNLNGAVVKGGKTYVIPYSRYIKIKRLG